MHSLTLQADFWHKELLCFTEVNFLLKSISEWDRKWGFPNCIYLLPGQSSAMAYPIWIFLLRKKEKGGGVKEKMFLLGLCLFPSPTILLPVLFIHEGGKKCITAEQMGTFHMTKPINHLGGAQVWHSRAATHHFTVYQAQTHGHQSMAPRGLMRRGASPQPHWFMADDFIITHPFSQRRKVMSSLMTSLIMWTPTL